MKTPLFLTLIILAAGSFWSVSENRNLNVLQEQHRKVLEEAATLGVSADLSKPFVSTKATKREHEDSQRKVKDFADTLVVFAKEMKEIQKNGGKPDENTQKRVMELLDGMLSMNGEELKTLIAELKGRKDMDDEMRKGIIGFSIMMLAQQHPQNALALFTESSDLVDDNGMGKHVLSAALTQWAKDEPLAALEWIKKNADKHPELVKNDAKQAVVMGAAQKDFGLAFQLAGELKLDQEDFPATMTMARLADTPERQAEFLIALRKQSAGLADKAQGEKLLNQGLGSLFGVVAESGYEKTMNWMKSANLSPEETTGLADKLNYYNTKADTGKWLDWMSTQTTEGGTSQDRIGNLVRQWTESDYKSAGEWLTKAAAGPVREAATMTYLETVAPYDSEVAAQWAATLPVDKQKDAMQRIFDTIERKDKAAAAEFARLHGIEVK